MQIVDLSPEHEKLYFLCLEDWSDELKEAGDHKEAWYGKTKGNVRVKLAVDDKGVVGGDDSVSSHRAVLCRRERPVFCKLYLGTRS